MPLIDNFSLEYWKNFERERNQQIYNNRKKISYNGYEENLAKLLKRYTFKGVPLWQEVTNLNFYKKTIGIYILCLPEVRGYYIGQTTVSFYKRIYQHWKRPKTTFDKTYRQSDVSNIYIIPLPKVLITDFDAIEQDCIASISNIFLLNSLMSPNYLVWIKDTNYHPKDFLIPSRKLYYKKKKIFEYQLCNGLS